MTRNMLVGNNNNNKISKDGSTVNIILNGGNYREKKKISTEKYRKKPTDKNYNLYNSGNGF